MVFKSSVVNSFRFICPWFSRVSLLRAIAISRTLLNRFLTAFVFNPSSLLAKASFASMIPLVDNGTERRLSFSCFLDSYSALVPWYSTGVFWFNTTIIPILGTAYPSYPASTINDSIVFASPRASE